MLAWLGRSSEGFGVSWAETWQRKKPVCRRSWSTTVSAKINHLAFRSKRFVTPYRIYPISGSGMRGAKVSQGLPPAEIAKGP
jgi:hypothetical protein